MGDDFEYRKDHNGSRISLEHEWEVDYWTKEMNCTEYELRKAIEEVGNEVEAVGEYLNAK